MASRWSRARLLTAHDWRLLIEAAGLLAWSHAAVRWTSPARVIARATSPRSGRTPVPPSEVERVARMTGAASRHAVRVACLARSVALARMLARRGVQAEIRVGVRMEAGQLEAHAWVEWDGRVLNDDQAHVRTYEPFARPLSDLARARFR